MIEKEIVQLIGADLLLCFLCDLANLIRWQELWADRRVEHRAQHTRGTCIRLGGKILNQMAHKRFGHAAVNTLHTHVVGIIGAPAKGELAQIPRSDENAALLIGEIHQDLCALTGLRVFIGYVVQNGIMADIRHML